MLSTTVEAARPVAFTTNRTRNTFEPVAAAASCQTNTCRGSNGMICSAYLRAEASAAVSAQAP